jgi:hypothetical protein
MDRHLPILVLQIYWKGVMMDICFNSLINILVRIIIHKNMKKMGKCILIMSD